MKLPMIQQTVVRTIRCSGVGLHSGRAVNLKIRPAPVNHGIRFKRTDLPDKPVIPARFNSVVDTSLATVIGTNGVIVSTIEHLMASLAGLSIDNALIELDDYEVPVMDGSAAPFAQIILDTGIAQQDAARHFFVLKEPIELKDDGKFVGTYPDSTFRITCNIDFDHPIIRKQTCSIEVLEQQFTCEISKARTFGFLHDVENLIRNGLARGGSLDNTVVLDKKDIINTDGLRYEDEFVRHKLLDCIGDFSLLGMPVLAHVVTNKSGHAFNHAFIKKFFEQKQSWDIKSLPGTDNTPPPNRAKSLAI